MTTTIKDDDGGDGATVDEVGGWATARRATALGFVAAECLRIRRQITRWQLSRIRWQQNWYRRRDVPLYVFMSVRTKRKGDDYMPHQWICTISVFGWCSYFRYIYKMATNGGSGVVDGVPLRWLQAILVLGWNPNLVSFFFFTNFCTNSYIRIRMIRTYFIQIV